MIETLAGVAVVVGSALVALAGLGVLRLPDLYSRMHAATKATTMGIGLVTIAAALAIPGAAAKAFLASMAIFFTAPSAAHLIGRGAYRAEGVELKLQGGDDLQELMNDEID